MWRKRLGLLAQRIGWRRGQFRAPSIPITSPALKELFRKAEIKILDVGARGGPQPQWAALAPFAHLYLVEPDAEEAERLEAGFEAEGQWRSVTIIREALGSKSGEAMLYVTRYPGLSSLLEPDDDRVGIYFPTSADFKKESREAWEVGHKARVSLTTLDEAAVKYGFTDISLLKLDTQGTELDILRSGEEKALPSALAVAVEGEFVPLYRGQPLFSEVALELEQAGFRLIDLKRTFIRRQNAAPSVRFSKPEIVYCHALFMRGIDGPAILRPLEKVRLLVLATAFWYFDQALALARDAEVIAYLGLSKKDALEKEIAVYADSVGRAVKKLSGRRNSRYTDWAFQDKMREC